MLLGRVLFAGFGDVVVYWLDDCCLICCLLLISSVVGCCCDLCRVAFALWIWWFGFDWLVALNAVWRWVQLVSVVFVCLLASLLIWLVFVGGLIGCVVVEVRLFLLPVVGGWCLIVLVSLRL